MKTIGKEREGKCKHNIYLASPFLPESLGVLFLKKCIPAIVKSAGRWTGRWSGRCYASAPNIAQSFAYFPCLLSQTTAIIQSPTNSLFLCFLWHFYCRRLVVSLHCSSNCFPGKLGKSNSWWVVTSWTPVLLSHAHKQPRQRHTPAFILKHSLFASFTRKHTLSCKDLSSNACQAQRRTSLPNQAAASHMHTVAFQ